MISPIEAKFRRFSRSKKQTLVERYEGINKDGIFIRKLIETIPIWASIQPYRTIEAEQIFNVEGGQRISSFSIMYSPILLQLDNDDEENRSVADIIIEETESGIIKYKPVRIEPWGFLRLKHYRAILRVFDGN